MERLCGRSKDPGRGASRESDEEQTGDEFTIYLVVSCLPLATGYVGLACQGQRQPTAFLESLANEQ